MPPSTRPSDDTLNDDVELDAWFDRYLRDLNKQHKMPLSRVGGSMNDLPAYGG